MESFLTPKIQGCQRASGGKESWMERASTKIIAATLLNAYGIKGR